MASLYPPACSAPSPFSRSPNQAPLPSASRSSRLSEKLRAQASSPATEVAETTARSHPEHRPPSAHAAASRRLQVPWRGGPRRRRPSGRQVLARSSTASIALKDLFYQEGNPDRRRLEDPANRLRAYLPTARRGWPARRRAPCCSSARSRWNRVLYGFVQRGRTFEPVHWPWDLTARPRAASSGNSAASVAARECFGALGTDTGEIDPATGRPVRHCRPQADLRPRRPL